MGIRLEDIHPLKASPVFRGISQKDRFELLKEIDARIVELGEGQLLRLSLIHILSHHLGQRLR